MSFMRVLRFCWATTGSPVGWARQSWAASSQKGSITGARVFFCGMLATSTGA
jgi:hypothetical protein